jgi:hypothetical protein
MAVSLVKAMRHREVKLMMAFVIGLGLATLLRAPCRGFLCRHFVAPDLQDVEGTVWKHGVGCMKVALQSSPCGSDSRQVITSA